MFATLIHIAIFALLGCYAA